MSQVRRTSRGSMVTALVVLIGPLDAAVATTPESCSLGMAALDSAGLRLRILRQGLSARRWAAGFGSAADPGDPAEQAVGQVDGARGDTSDS